MIDKENQRLLDEIDKLDDVEFTESTSVKNSKNLKKVIISVILVSIALLTIQYLTNLEMEASYESILNEEDEDFDKFIYNEDYEDHDYGAEVEFEQAQKVLFDIQKTNLVVKKEVLSINKELISVINNNNDEAMKNVLVQVIFYNGENKPIKIDESSISLLEPHMDYYIKFSGAPEEYERCEYLFTQEYLPLKTLASIKDQVKFELFNKSEDCVQLKVNNLSDKMASRVNMVVVYYDDKDNILDINEWDFYDVKKKDIDEEDIYIDLYNFDTNESVDFSRYDVLLQEAYTE